MTSQQSKGASPVPSAFCQGCIVHFFYICLTSSGPLVVHLDQHTARLEEHLTLFNGEPRLDETELALVFESSEQSWFLTGPWDSYKTCPPAYRSHYRLHSGPGHDWFLST